MRIVNFNKRYSSLEVGVDELAGQLTLIDFNLFKSIQRDEILNLEYTATKSKLKRQLILPNIIAMNRQFNQVSYWVIGQVLHHQSPRIRAELISDFIKLSKRLYHLNNLHSSFACLSALLSSPIYRLDQTWHLLRKKYPKEKLILAELIQLFSDDNNYESLRNHLQNSSPPCVPYIGLYARDMIYIKEVHSEGSAQREDSIRKILNSIEKFQSSDYNHLGFIPDLNMCLLSNRYIDELQRFVEDDSYRRSLELEPPRSLTVDHNHNNNNQNNLMLGNEANYQCQSSIPKYKKSAFILASLTSIVQSAVATTSNRLGGSHPRRSGNESHKDQIYLIDDSPVSEAIFPS